MIKEANQPKILVARRHSIVLGMIIPLMYNTCMVFGDESPNNTSASRVETSLKD